ncbi:hypothetical protein EX30DRAFT_347801 [Ascodesmis nigricans]|uniref:Uncharacterized protein n=1 Tax=Ascodesmis nigricans TaxID=341454 RepID=A0A4S2N0C3_9PEZI|nr:hypothetical protein EX30DRAFT_347801 [Ascodesmis nigricans]
MSHLMRGSGILGWGDGLHHRRRYYDDALIPYRNRDMNTVVVAGNDNIVCLGDHGMFRQRYGYDCHHYRSHHLGGASAMSVSIERERDRSFFGSSSRRRNIDIVDYRSPMGGGCIVEVDDYDTRRRRRHSDVFTIGGGMGRRREEVRMVDCGIGNGCVERTMVRERETFGGLGFGWLRR